VKKLTTEQFIQKAKSVHGDKYDYCKENNINLIRIPYTKMKNIEQILSEKLHINEDKNVI
jgi:hypothetical protein